MKKIPTQQEHEKTELLIKASRNGDIDEVKRLISGFTKPVHSGALAWAAGYGQTKVVALLLPVSDPKANNSLALEWAAEEGYIECVKLLLPMSDPTATHSSALWKAAANGHTEIVKLLIPVSNCNEAIKQMKREGKDITLLQLCVDEYEAMLQKDRLLHTLEDTASQSNSTKRKI